MKTKAEVTIKNRPNLLSKGLGFFMPSSSLFKLFSPLFHKEGIGEFRGVLLLFLASFIFIGSRAFASSSDIYIAQTQFGTGDASSCANAQSIAWANDYSINQWGGFVPTNWVGSSTSGKIGPGTTIHLCGVISTGLIIQASGTGPFVPNSPGTGYNPGDVLSISGGTGAQIQVIQIGCAGGSETVSYIGPSPITCPSGGQITQFTINAIGSGYGNVSGLTSSIITRIANTSAPAGTGATFSSQAPEPINIVFEAANGNFPNAKMSAPAFPTAITSVVSWYSRPVSYINIDGCYGGAANENSNGICNSSADQAIIENTNNGSAYEYWAQYCSQYYKSAPANIQSTYSTICNNINSGIQTTNPTYPNFQQTSSTAISFPGYSSNITIKNLVMQDLYMRAPSSADPAGGWGFVTQDQVEYTCSSGSSCNQTTPTGLTWSNVVSAMVNGGWATQPLSTILQPTSQYTNDSSLTTDMQNLFGSNAAYILNLFANTYSPGSGMGISLPGASNVTIQNNTITMAQTPILIPIPIAGQQDIKIDSNRILGYNHAIEMGSGAPYPDSPPATLNGLIISNNDIDGYDVWENVQGFDIGFHRNALFIFNDPSIGFVKNVDIYNNHFGPGFNPQTTGAGSNAIRLEAGFNYFENLRIYNNIFDLPSTVAYSDGWNMAGGGNFLFANNTIVGGSYLNGGGENSYIFNNLKISSGAGIDLLDNGTSNSANNYLSTEFSDYNLYSGMNAVTQGFDLSDASRSNPNSFYSFAGWQALQGTGNPFDANSQFGQALNPYLCQGNPNAQSANSCQGNNTTVADYHLQAWSPAINAGKNLSQFCNAWPQAGPWDNDTGSSFVPLSALCNDKDGNQRPNPNSTVDSSSTDPWDIGAYYFSPQADRPVLGGPVAQGQTVYVTIGGKLNITLTGTAPNSDPLSYSILTPPSHGTLADANGNPLTGTFTNPSIEYTNSGGTSDSFVFQVTDTKSNVTSNQAMVSITVNNISISLGTTNGVPTNFNTGSNIPLTAAASIVLPGSGESIGSVSFNAYLNCITTASPVPIGTVTTGQSGNSGNQYNITWSDVLLTQGSGSDSYCVTAQATESASTTDPNNGQIAITTLHIVVYSAPPDVISNLVGYWNFDEGTNSTAYDCSSLSSGNYILPGNTNCKGNNNGTLQGNTLPSWVSGPPGSLQFNASQNQSVAFGTANIPSPNNVTSPITVSAWVKTGSSSETGQIISRMMDGYPIMYWLLQFQGTNDLVFYDRAPNGYLYEVDPGISITPDVWHHVAVTYDGSSYNVMNIYIDGALKSSAESLAADQGIFNALHAPTTMTIGSGTSAAISDVRIFNRALAAQDINELYSMGQPVTYGLNVTTGGNGTGTYSFNVSTAVNNNGIWTLTNPWTGTSCGPTCTAVPFNAGAVVTLTAAPQTGYVVSSWSSNCAPVTGNPNACTITMNSTQTVTANFTTAPVLGSGDVSGNGPVTMYDAALALIDYAAGGGCTSTAITAQLKGACARAGMDPQGTIGSVDSVDVIDIAKKAMGL